METPPYRSATTHPSTVSNPGLDYRGPIKRISWAAVFAGVILAMVVQVLLSMLGTGVGLSTVDPLQAEGTPSASAFGIGAGLWWGISSLVALFIGGWVAGHLAGVPRALDGALHGLLAWGLTTLLTLYLLGSAIGSIVSGAGSVLGSAVSVAGAGAAAAAPKVVEVARDQVAQSGISWDSIKREAQQLLSQTGKPALQPGALEQQAKGAAKDATQAGSQAAATPAAVDREFDSLMEKLLSRGKETASQVDRDAVINVMVARTGMSREEAAKRVDNWETTYQQMRVKAEQTAQQTKQKALEAADTTARGVSRAALWGFFALMLGGIAAAWGGMAGRPRTALA